jgi:hypothetical protein
MGYNSGAGHLDIDVVAASGISPRERVGRHTIVQDGEAGRMGRSAATRRNRTRIGRRASNEIQGSYGSSRCRPQAKRWEGVW